MTAAGLVTVFVVTLLAIALWPTRLLPLYVFVIGLCALRMLWMVIEMRKSFAHLHEIAAQMAETHLDTAKRYDEQELHAHVELVQAIAADIRMLGRRVGTHAGIKDSQGQRSPVEPPTPDRDGGGLTEPRTGEVVIAEPVKDGE
jgi:hypothetical protein